MLRQDRIAVGLLVGLVLPVLGFMFFYQIFNLVTALGWLPPEGLGTNFRERTLAIVSIALNILPLRLFAARRANQSLRGIVIITFVLAMAWFVHYGLKLI